jgi:Zn-dependent metalloprotease
MTYGDGDGTIFQPLSQDADVVAQNTSGLIYRGESGGALPRVQKSSWQGYK